MGLGNIAWRFNQNVKSEYGLTHNSVYIQNPQTSVAGGCSPEKGDSKTFERMFGVAVYKTLEELIDTTKPDIVSICSPSEFHFEQVMYCLDRNVPMIWLEKPPASSVQEIDRLIDKMAEQGNRSKVLVNYQRRYDKNYQKLKEIYLEKMLGTCRLIQINYSRGLELNGSHILDMLFFIIGDGMEYEIEWVFSFDSLENPSFALTLECGVGVVVSGVTLPYHCVDISLICENGRASILHGGMTPVVEERVEHELFPGFYRLKKSEDDYFVSFSQTNSMKEVLENLIYSYEQGNETKSSLQSARNTQALIDKVREKQRKQVS